MISFVYLSNFLFEVGHIRFVWAIFTNRAKKYQQTCKSMVHNLRPVFKFLRLTTGQRNWWVQRVQSIRAPGRYLREFLQFVFFFYPKPRNDAQRPENWNYRPTEVDKQLIQPLEEFIHAVLYSQKIFKPQK